MRASVLVLWLLLCGTVFAQGNAGAARMPSAKNVWQHVAMPLPKQQALSPTELAARGAYFDKLIGYRYPLDTAGKDAERVGFSFEPAHLGEVPIVGVQQMVAVGTFVGFQPELSTTRRSIYTVIHFGVERTVRNHTSKTTVPKTIDVLVPGGTVLLATGKVISYAVTPDPNALIPGQRYVALLTYHPDGDFYTCAKSWLVRNGKVWPNTLGDLIRQRQGRSSYSGAELFKFLSIFSPH